MRTWPVERMIRPSAPSGESVEALLGEWQGEGCVFGRAGIPPQRGETELDSRGCQMTFSLVSLARGRQMTVLSVTHKGLPDDFT